jgi:hypothetical protein
VETFPEAVRPVRGRTVYGLLAVHNIARLPDKIIWLRGWRTHSADAAMAAGRKKESGPLRDMGADPGAERLQILSR